MRISSLTPLLLLRALLMLLPFLHSCRWLNMVTSYACHACGVRGDAGILGRVRVNKWFAIANLLSTTLLWDAGDASHMTQSGTQRPQRVVSDGRHRDEKPVRKAFETATFPFYQSAVNFRYLVSSPGSGAKTAGVIYSKVRTMCEDGVVSY